MTHTHTITDAEFALASRLATETIAMFAGRQGYYNNTPQSHLRGKVGEIGATAALMELGIAVDPLWQDVALIGEADLVCGDGLRADVKTWDRRYWSAMGRCVAVGQLPKLRQKADAIIWCSSASVLEPGMHVQTVGWNSIADIEVAPRRLTGPANRRQVDNYQVDVTDVRDLSSLRTPLR